MSIPVHGEVELNANEFDRPILGLDSDYFHRLKEHAALHENPIFEPSRE